MTSQRKNENGQERNLLFSNRRRYLKLAGMSVAGGISSLSGCSGVDVTFGPSPEFEPDMVFGKTGTLPEHELNLFTSKKRGNPDEAIEISDSGLSADKNSTTEFELISLEASVDPRGDLTRDELRAAACSTAIRETYWEAPHSGRFETRATYDVDGSWGYRFTCPDIVDEQINLHTAANLVVLNNPESETKSDSETYLNHSAATDSGKNDSVESLLKFIISQIISRRVGPVASVVADPVVDAVIEWGDALVDIATGDCVPTKRDRDGFASITNTLKNNFTAEAGKVYKIVLVPTIGWEYSANAINDASTAFVSSEFALSDISIE